MAKVLVAEDESVLRYLICDAIVQSGHQVREVIDGRSALDLLPTFQPDLLVTDIEMPLLTGIELVTAIRQTRPYLPIVVLSGGDAALLEQAKQAGADVCLGKPVDIGLFIRKVQRLLSDAGSFRPARVA